ncbi:MAG: trigger factor [Pseudomonadales bacterium]|jgi:trigger factor
MQVSVENLSSIERRLTIGVPAERVESEVEGRLKETAKRARIDGFRPGKVPLKVVKQRYGAGIRQEVLGEVMRQSFYEAVTQEKLNPVGQPSIEPKALEAGKDLEYTATFEVFPEIEFTDLSKIEVEKTLAQVEDKDVDEQITQLQEQQQEMKSTKRAAKEGDQVVISFEGKLDGEVFEGGSSDETPLILGSKTMIPGFEDGLLGAKPGEERVLDLTFPENYHSEELAGKAVQFTVNVKKSFKPAPAELNDEFFAKYGVTEGGEEAFRSQLRESMENALEGALKNQVKSHLIDAIVDAHEIAIPSALVDDEINNLRQQMVQQFGGGQQQIDPSMFPAELFKDRAEKRVASGLVIQKFIQDNELSVSDEQVRSVIEDFAENYEDKEEIISHVYANEQQLQHFQTVALEDLVIEKLLETVKVKEVKGSYQDVMNPPAPAEDAES